MNKAKTGAPKKFLVRNTQQPVPKTKLIVEDGDSCDKIKNTNKGAPGSSRAKKSPNLDAPELNSTLAISKKIDLVAKTKSKKFQSGSDLAFDEKVTRQVNFPYDKPIYKDLISLEVANKRTTTLTPRLPLPLKDKEPKLSDYVTPREAKEYIYKPQIRLPDAPKQPKTDNLRIYKLTQIQM